MTNEQRAALQWLRETNANAVWTDAGWVWAQDVRESTAAARVVLRTRDRAGAVKA